MKKMGKALIATICAGALAVGCMGLVACGGSGSNSGSNSAAADYKLIKEGTLIIGSDLDFPPMEYLDGDTATGFGIAMIEEICDRIGLKAEVLPPQNFDSLMTQVSGGATMDVAVSSITITDEREEMVSFSTPYYDSNLAVVTLKKSDFKAKEDLNGENIGVQSGSSGEAWAKENLKDSSVKPYNGPSDALASLRAGDVKAVIYDLPVAQNHVSNEYTDCQVLEEIPTGEQYGIAVNKDNTALTEAINAALADMEADGTLDQLKEKWIG